MNSINLLQEPSAPPPLFVDDLLEKQAAKVDMFGLELEELVKNMRHAIREHPGSCRAVGLAAPQIGNSQRVVLMEDYRFPSDKEAYIVYVNPEIIEQRGSMISHEYCLSIPGSFGFFVIRPSYVRVKARDINGNAFEEELHGLHAQIMRHEIDHLNGITVMDRSLLGKFWKDVVNSMAYLSAMLGGVPYGR